MVESTKDCVEEMEHILALTRDARARAQAGEWDAAIALEAQRRPLLERFFAQPIPAQDKRRVATAIRTILSSDAGLIALAAAGRSEAADESRRLRSGRRAAAAYVAAGAFGSKRLPPGGKGLPIARGPMREVIDL